MDAKITWCYRQKRGFGILCFDELWKTFQHLSKEQGTCDSTLVLVFIQSAVVKFSTDRSEYKTTKPMDIAISYSETDASVAQAISEHLARLGVAHYLYSNLNTFGKSLRTTTTSVYGEEAKCCLVLVSKHYAQTTWSSEEWRIILQTAATRPAGYILPVRIDQASLSGLPDDLVYIEWKGTNAPEIAQKASERLHVMMSQSQQNEPGNTATQAQTTTNNHINANFGDGASGVNITGSHHG